MNYLVHLYLADNNDESLIGTMLGDFVKGRGLDQYPDQVKAGIISHRKIDSYSDAHPVTLQSRNRISPQRRRFAGVIVDVCYDHFLARHWRRFSGEALPSFVKRVYADMLSVRFGVPLRLQQVMHFMISEDWLGNYVSLENTARALDRIAARLTRGERFMGSVQDIKAEYRLLESDFLTFFPDLLGYSRTAVKE